MYVIGTAGHVDHGKSTLVQHLTGIDPDRLKEEKQRKLTIDLGFAWFNLDDNMIGIVDVPGHRDFIENMLAGVGGMDAVMLVIAADEGVMPQTREHLAILDLLGIAHGLVALTKIDMLADDPDWLDLVQADIAETLQGTVLQDAPIVPVSGKTGAGIDDLLRTLADVLASIPAQPTHGTPRLPVDRVFSMSGFGTVVTGTLTGGTLTVGDEVEIQPGNHKGRVRGLQSYEQDVHTAQAGSRTAINISGVDKKDIQRGSIVAYPNTVQPTLMIDVHYRHLPDAPHPLKHNADVKLFVGSAQVMGTVRLLDADILNAGESGWLQIRLKAPIATSRGDRFILRLPSPKMTIGGGVVVNPTPGQRYKRFRPNIIETLRVQLSGSPTERLMQICDTPTPQPRKTLISNSGLPIEDTHAALQSALDSGHIIQCGEDAFISAHQLQQQQNRIIEELTRYHQENRLRQGMPREALRSRIQWPNKLFDWLVHHVNDVVSEHDGNLLRLTSHQVQFTEAEQRAIHQLEQALHANPTTPPAYAQAVQIVGDEALLGALIERGDVVQVASDVIFSRQAYDMMRDGVLEMLDNQQSVNVQTVRDRFNTSRKYAVALLEHLDHIGITRRQGDERVKA